MSLKRKKKSEKENRFSVEKRLVIQHMTGLLLRLHGAARRHAARVAAYRRRVVLAQTPHAHP